PLKAAAVGFQSRHGRFDGCAKSDYARDILGSRPATMLLAAAPHERRNAFQAFTQNKRAHSLGTADLVCRDGHKISAQTSDIERYFSQSLDRVDMQHTACFMYDASCFADWLKCPRLVIRRHDRDQRRLVRCEPASQNVEVDHA